MKFTRFHLTALILCLTLTIQSQTYKDVLQIYRTDAAHHILDIIVDNDKRYLVLRVGNHMPGDKIYFNDEDVITLETELTDDWTAEQMRLLVEISDTNEYIDHTLVTYNQKNVLKLKLIDGEIYCLLGADDFADYEIIRYNDGINVDRLFAFQDSQRIWIDDFTLFDDKLLVGGTFIAVDSFIYYDQDTLWTPNLDHVSNHPDFLYYKDLTADSIIHSLSYGGEYYGISLDGLDHDSEGNALIWGKHSREFVIQGDTIDYKGGGPGDDDAFLFSLEPDGNLKSLHSFCSTSHYENIHSVWLGPDDSYYVTVVTAGTGTFYVDDLANYQKEAPYQAFSLVYKFNKQGELQWQLPIKNFYGLRSWVYGEDDDYMYLAVDLASSINTPLVIGDEEIAFDPVEDKESYVIHFKLDKNDGQVVYKSKPVSNGIHVRYSNGLYKDSPNSLVFRFDDTEVILNDINYPQYVDGYNIDVLVNVDYTSAFIDEPIGKGFEVNVFPNPLKANEILHVISENSKALTYEMISMDGQVVQSGKINKNSLSIENAKLSSGIYFLKLEQGNKVIYKKIFFTHN